ncbi:MAG: hypothetical protein RLZ25_257 [Pseudomonadota bacterium]|jgi:conjugal transfer pilin signal peptidase TrbI
MSTLNSPTSDSPRACPPALDRLLNGIVVFIVLYALFAWFSHRFLVGHDSQKVLCLSGNHRWYLIDRSQRQPELGDLVAFRSDEQMAPEIPFGTLVVKRVEALPGDNVDIESLGLRIQGEMLPVRYPHRARLKDRALPTGSRVLVPEGNIWVMGDHPRSFDSRYFGPIADRQIIGVAHALPF